MLRPRTVGVRETSYAANHITDQSRVLDARIVCIASRILVNTAWDSGPPRLESPGMLSVDEIFCAGRIRMAYDKPSAHLECSRDTAGGLIVALDLTALPGCSLFTGQVVVVRGRYNMLSEMFCVSMVYTNGLPEMKRTLSTSYAQHYTDSVTGTDIVIAAGPFSSYDNVLYTPLVKLLDALSASPPHVLILLGPFVDAQNTLVRSAAVDQTFEDIFKYVDTVVSAFCRTHNVTKLFVPSLRDVHHYNVFPQLPFEGHETSNPCTVGIREMVFGICNTDVVLHARSSLVNCKTPPLKRVCEAILEQGLYYPVSPTKEVNLHLVSDISMPYCPDVFIVPTILKAQTFPLFDNKVQMVMVNPLVKPGNSTGSYMRLHVLRPPHFPVCHSAPLRLLNDVPARVDRAEYIPLG